MEVIRLLHIRDYDPQFGRFRSEVFRNSSDGSGISVFTLVCAIGASGSGCEHARRFYPTRYVEPPIFWLINMTELPNCDLIQKTSSSGDACHHNLVGLSDNAARRFFKAHDVGSYFICNGNTHVPATWPQVKALHEAFLLTLKTSK